MTRRTALRSFAVELLEEKSFTLLQFQCLEMWMRNLYHGLCVMQVDLRTRDSARREGSTVEPENGLMHLFRRDPVPLNASLVSSLTRDAKSQAFQT
jgi:hypothetical protein